MAKKAAKRVIIDPKSQFGRMFNEFSGEYLLETIPPHRLDHFFRSLIQHMNDSPIEDVEVFLDWIQSILPKCQAKFSRHAPIFVRKYKALLRVQRAEQKNGTAPIALRDDLAAANRNLEAASEAIDAIKE